MYLPTDNPTHSMITGYIYPWLTTNIRNLPASVFKGIYNFGNVHLFQPTSIQEICQKTSCKNLIPLVAHVIQQTYTFFNFVVCIGLQKVTVGQLFEK